MQVELNVEFMRSTGIASSVAGGGWDDVSCIISRDRAWTSIVKAKAKTMVK